MAIVKLQGGKVITKSGKVSCSCCVTGCCMYPAAGLLNGFISEGDLPDSIFMLPYDLSAVIGSYAGQEVQRQGTTYETPPFSPATFTQSVEYIANFEGLGPQWLFKTNANNITVIDYRQCLFNPEQEGEYAEDMFEESYTVTHPDSSGTVTRASLCRWEGTDGNGCPLELEYIGPDPNSTAAQSQFAYKWNVSYGQNLPPEEPCLMTGVTKIGTQNSPVGEYADEFGGTATVS